MPTTYAFTRFSVSDFTQRQASAIPQFTSFSFPGARVYLCRSPGLCETSRQAKRMFCHCNGSCAFKL